MILQCDEAAFATHLRVTIGECGEYDVIDFGADGLNATSDDVTTTQSLDPFTFTVDIA